MISRFCFLRGHPKKYTKHTYYRQERTVATDGDTRWIGKNS